MFSFSGIQTPPQRQDRDFWDSSVLYTDDSTRHWPRDRHGIGHVTNEQPRKETTTTVLYGARKPLSLDWDEEQKSQGLYLRETHIELWSFHLLQSAVNAARLYHPLASLIRGL